MERQDKAYYKKSWFSDRNQSLLNLLFNVVDPKESDSLLENSKPKIHCILVYLGSTL